MPSLDTAHISVPEEPGIVFTYPDVQAWRLLLRRNAAALAARQERAVCRRELLEAARSYTAALTGATTAFDLSAPVVATGHQATWHHCGIWAKDLVLGKFAQASGATPLHLVLDHGIDETAMLLPQASATEGIRSDRFELEPPYRRVGLEYRPQPDLRLVRQLMDRIARTPGDHLCLHAWNQARDRIGRAWKHGRSIADAITCLQALLLAPLGIPSLLYLPVSALSETEAFLGFALSIIADADAYARQYNAGLCRRPIRSRQSRRVSIRRLTVSRTDDAVELPFWLVARDGSRQTLAVKGGDGSGTRIGTAKGEIGEVDTGAAEDGLVQLREVLRQHHYHLRPKAVTLTLFVRLLIADWFIHGVGGLRYEFLTDHLFSEYYGVRPPAYGVATCTMRLLPGDDSWRPRPSAAGMQHPLRQIRFHPETCIEPADLENEPVRELIRSKREQIKRSTDSTLTKDQRRAAWYAIARTNELLAKHVQATAIEFRQPPACATGVYEFAGREREYFFGLFPEDRLRRLAETVHFE